MSKTETGVVVDFVARGSSSTEWKLVLVEQGPWTDIFKDLKRLQKRLYNTIDAVLDGQVATKFPESKGKNIVIQLDGYNLPVVEVAEFFDRFSAQVLKTTDYENALKDNPFVNHISFQSSFQSIA